MMRGRRCIRMIPMLEICEDRIALDGAAGAGVQDEGPVMTMQDIVDVPGSWSNLVFSPDPEPSDDAGLYWVIDGWVDKTQELQFEFGGATQVPPVILEEGP